MHNELVFCCVFQAEDGIRDLVRSRGLGDVYKRQEQETIIINEAGLYSLILRSKKPEAKPFQRWVTHELLPQLRKVGFYGQLDIKTRITLGNHLRVLCQALARSLDAFEQQALLGRVREVCLLLGQSMPNVALLGKDPKQLTLRGV